MSALDPGGHAQLSAQHPEKASGGCPLLHGPGGGGGGAFGSAGQREHSHVGLPFIKLVLFLPHRAGHWPLEQQPSEPRSATVSQAWKCPGLESDEGSGGGAAAADGRGGGGDGPELQQNAKL